MGSRSEGTMHTKGPWECGRLKRWKDDPISGSARLIDSDGFWFGPVGHKHDIGEVYAGPDVEEQEANLRLIVASPEMLDALIDVRDNGISGRSELWRRVDAVIAKATTPKAVNPSS